MESIDVKTGFTPQWLKRINELNKATIMANFIKDNLPYGRWLTNDDEYYYFNRKYNVIYACDSEMTTPIATTRDCYIDNSKIVSTEYFYDDGCDIASDATQLREVHLIHYEAMARFGIRGELGSGDGELMVFNQRPENATKGLIKTSLLMGWLPYGKWLTEDGKEFYFGREYHVIYGWDIIENRMIPVHRQMYTNKVDIVDTEYFGDWRRGEGSEIASIRRHLEIICRMCLKQEFYHKQLENK